MTAAPLSYFQAAVIVLLVSLYAFVCMFISGIRFVHVKGFSCCHSLLYIHYFSLFLRTEIRSPHLCNFLFHVGTGVHQHVSPSSSPVKPSLEKCSRSCNNQAAQLKKSMSINVFICSKLIELKGSVYVQLERARCYFSLLNQNLQWSPEIYIKWCCFGSFSI